MYIYYMNNKFYDARNNILNILLNIAMCIVQKNKSFYRDYNKKNVFYIILFVLFSSLFKLVLYTHSYT